MGITQIIPDGLTHHQTNNNSNHLGTRSHNHNHSHNQHQLQPLASSSPVAMRSYSDSAKSSFDFSAIQAQLPPNTGPPGTVPVTNGSSSSNNKNLGHVPCKFYRQGICQAGNTCPFSHNLDGALGADKVPCKYFQKGNCKFGLKCALAHFLPDGTRVNSKNFMLTGAGHNGGKQNTRRSSFNNSTFGNTSSSTLKNTSAIVTGATPPEYENSFFSSDYTSASTSAAAAADKAFGSSSNSPTNVVNHGSAGALSNHNVATFINIGYTQPPSAQPHQQPQQSSQQEPISLSLITQESLARSSSFSRSEFNYQFPPQSSSVQNKPSSYHNGFQTTSPNFQNQANSYGTSTSINNNNHYHQRLLLIQNLFFGSNSYSGAFATNASAYNTAPTQTSPFAKSKSISLSLNTSMNVSDSPTEQYASANSTWQTAAPSYVSSSTTPTSRFSFGSRVPSQSYQNNPQHSKILGGYIQDPNNSSAIVDDDDFPLPKAGITYDNVFFMDNE